VLGGTDPKFYTGNFTYVDLEEDYYYIVGLGGVAVGSKSFNVPSMKAIIDTGTSLIVGPTTWVN